MAVLSPYPSISIQIPLSSHESTVHLDSVWQPSQQFHPQYALHQHFAEAVMVKSILATWAPTIQSSANYENRNMEIPNIFARNKPSIIWLSKNIYNRSVYHHQISENHNHHQPPPPAFFLCGSSGMISKKSFTPLMVDT